MDEDLRSASESVGEVNSQDSHLKPTKKSISFKKILMVLGILILLVMLVLGTQRFIFKTDVPEPDASTTQEAQDVATPTYPEDVPESAEVLVFKSTALGLQLNHPKTWTATEKDGGVRLESPAFSFTTKESQKVNGKFRIYIRKGAREVDGNYIGRGYAIKPSEKLVYMQPAPGQRTETLLSSFGLDTSDNFGFFMIAGNFQLNKDDTLGPDYGKEPDAFIVGGGYSSDELTEDLQTYKMPLDSYSTTKAYAQALSIVESLQLR